MNITNPTLPRVDRDTALRAAINDWLAGPMLGESVDIESDPSALRAALSDPAGPYWHCARYIELSRAAYRQGDLQDALLYMRDMRAEKAHLPASLRW